MLIFLIIAVPAVGLFTWLYMRLASAGTTLKDRAWFEITVFLCQLAAGATAAFCSHATLADGPDRAWWPFIGFFYWMFLIPAVFLA